MRLGARTTAALTLAVLTCIACTHGGGPEERSGMAYIPAGEFLMGSAADDPIVYPWIAGDEQPQHPVNVDAFYIDLHEVTNLEYERVKPDHPRHPLYSACDDCPVDNVSWFEARDYCAAQKPPKRLPTEAEWEKAAKGGTDGHFEPFDDYAWYAKNTHAPQPVALKRANPYGLFDVLGNVREWTSDWFDPHYYALRVHDNPKGPDTGIRRVERGGAFFLPKRGVTLTIRYNHPPDFQLYFLGFRCAQDV